MEFCQNRWHQQTRVHALSYGVVCVILCLAILVQYRRVTDRQTDRRTHNDSIYSASTVKSNLKRLVTGESAQGSLKVIKIAAVRWAICHL